MRKVPLLLSLLLATTGLAAPAQAGPRAAATYTNPVSAGTVDTFPDPATIKAKDGRWYAYGTGNPIFNSRGETGEHILPILSSSDLVHWTYEGDGFQIGATPSWWPSDARLWAPDIRYFNNEYRLTYSLSVGGIGLMTSANPAGPWTDRGQVLPASNGCPTGTIDQAMFQDTDGSYYLYWGSYDTICVARMNADATGITGTVTQIARGRRMEGGYVVHRGGYYYLFYSDGGCCDGAFSGYVTKVGRATSPTGPFTSPAGVNLLADVSKDGIVVAANGNGFSGPGHNSLTTDLSGQDWLVYHAISDYDPDFPAVTGANGATLRLTKRPLMIDRLDWIDGWPVVNAGAGPSATATTAPVTAWTVGSDFNSGSAGFGSQWSLVDGHLATSAASSVLSDAAVSGDVRVEGDVRGSSAGVVMAYQSGDRKVEAWLDGGTKRLIVSVGGVQAATAVLPSNFNYNSWHTIALEKRGTTLSVEVTAARLRDAVATTTVTLPAGYTSGRIGAVSKSGAAQVDNLGAAPLYQPVTRRVSAPALGAVLYADEFTGSSLGSAWSWVRGNPGATLSGGSLVWPTQAAELYQTTNTASVLTRAAPAGDYVVETKLTFDGTTGNQQAGILLYENDDRFVKLVHSVLPLNNAGGAVQHTTEFTKEHTRVSTGAVFAGPMFGKAPAATTWLRLAYHYDAAHDENDVRMAQSTDGVTWEWGGSWSFPHNGDLEVGLVSMNTAGATGTFDYVRAYRLLS